MEFGFYLLLTFSYLDVCYQNATRRNYGRPSCSNAVLNLSRPTNRASLGGVNVNRNHPNSSVKNALPLASRTLFSAHLLKMTCSRSRYFSTCSADNFRLESSGKASSVECTPARSRLRSIHKNIPAFLSHYHQLLPFIQSRNTEKNLRIGKVWYPLLVQELRCDGVLFRQQPLVCFQEAVEVALVFQHGCPDVL